MSFSFHILQHFLGKQSLREKCPNTQLFLVRIFPHSDWMRRDTKYLSVFSPNAGKDGPEITRYLDTFRAVSNEFFSVVVATLKVKTLAGVKNEFVFSVFLSNKNCGNR